MSGSKDQILRQIQASSGRGDLSLSGKEALESALLNPAANLVPARSAGDRRAQIALFRTMVEASVASIEVVAEEAEVPFSVSAWLTSNNLPENVVVAGALSSLPWSGAAMLDVREGKATQNDEVGVNSGFAGIAETGTVMCVSGSETPTTLNFVPDTEIIVLRTSEVGGSMEDAFDRLRAVGAMPRAVNFITGPSRTGDINRTMYMGAHGPRRVHVILIDDEGVAADA